MVVNEATSTEEPSHDMFGDLDNGSPVSAEVRNRSATIKMNGDTNGVVVPPCSPRQPSGDDQHHKSFLHQLTHRHNHIQGHNWNSTHHSSNSSSHPNNPCSTTQCTLCFPNCLPTQQLLYPHAEEKSAIDGNINTKESTNQHAESTEEQPDTEQKHKHPHHRISLASLTASISHIFSHHHNKHSEINQTKSRFHIPFHAPRSHPPKKATPRHFGPLLYGTLDWSQHDAKIKSIVHVCELFRSGVDLNEYSNHVMDNEHDATYAANISLNDSTRARDTLSSIGFEFRVEFCEECKSSAASSNEGDRPQSSYDNSLNSCPKCITRLYHSPSNTAVTHDNRKSFIADGKMYEEVANLCQSVAQEFMAEMFNFTWVTVCDGKGGGLRASQRFQATTSKGAEEWPEDEHGNMVIREPIRALVGRHEQCSTSHPRDTFLVATGKGKVRAGIFSRQHLMTTGLEPSTAIPLLREACERGMNCVVIDPNARGDKEGLGTFELSIRSLFENPCGKQDKVVESDSDAGVISDIISAEGSIYVLAHSAAGGHLVRYLLAQQDGALLSRIKSISFTDSTHSIQWTKKYPHLMTMLQSSKALYVRTPNPIRDDGWENARPGDECSKDQFWSHRFGNIKTVWAGTTDHSLAPSAANACIWKHFDEAMHAVEKNEGTGDE
eukprot:g2713.t1 g2713   contig12:664282-666276(-)